MAAARSRFWLRWLAATVAGGLLALAFHLLAAIPVQTWLGGTVPASGLRDASLEGERGLAFLAGSVIVAAAQAVVVRRLLGRVVPWLTGAAVGALLQWFLVRWLLSSTPHSQAPDGLLLACLGALLFSACLWVTCLSRADRLGLFIGASVIAAALVHLYVSRLFPLSAGVDPRPSLIGSTVASGLVTGGLTGLALAFTLLRPRPRPHPRPRARRPATRRQQPARSRSAR